MTLRFGAGAVTGSEGISLRHARMELCQANTAGNRKRLVANVVGVVDDLAQYLLALHFRGHRAAVVQDDDELITAHAPQHVRGAKTIAQTLRDLNQYLVTRKV